VINGFSGSELQAVRPTTSPNRSALVQNKFNENVSNIQLLDPTRATSERQRFGRREFAALHCSISRQCGQHRQYVLLCHALQLALIFDLSAAPLLEKR
jgi:hypothetical protein